MKVQSQFIEMFGNLKQDTPWSEVVTITMVRPILKSIRMRALILSVVVEALCIMARRSCVMETQ